MVTRKRYPVKRMSFRNVSIQNSVLANHHAALVRQHWVINMIRVREFPERNDRVVRNRCDLDALLCECDARMFQLDELASAVGSPISAASKHQQQPVRPDQILERPLSAVLICELE